MRILAFIVVGSVALACGHAGDQQLTKGNPFADTTVSREEWWGEFRVRHYTTYDSVGDVSFQTESVSAFDTVAAMKPEEAGVGGHSFAFGPYRIWTRSASNDTFQVMIDSVRTGRFLCYRDSSVEPEARVIERRTVSYGAYENAGFLVVPSHSDTLLLWYYDNQGLSRPAVWNWEEQLPPMTWEDYKRELADMQQLSTSIASNAQIDSIISRGQ